MENRLERTDESEEEGLLQMRVHKDLTDEIISMLGQLDDRSLNIIHRFIQRMTQ